MKNNEGRGGEREEERERRREERSGGGGRWRERERDSLFVGIKRGSSPLRLLFSWVRAERAAFSLFPLAPSGAYNHFALCAGFLVA